MKKIFLALICFCFASCAYSQDVIIKQTFYLINQNRKLNNLNELYWNDDLAKAAKFHSNWMAKVGIMTHLQGEEPKGFVEFQNSTHHPVNRLIKFGYYPAEKVFHINHSDSGVQVQSRHDINDFWGEIIAHGKSDFDRNYPYRADICVNGWMNSPGHKAQILRPSFREMGIAITTANNGREVFWCVNFGCKD